MNPRHVRGYSSNKKSNVNITMDHIYPAAIETIEQIDICEVSNEAALCYSAFVLVYDIGLQDQKYYLESPRSKKLCSVRFNQKGRFLLSGERAGNIGSEIYLFDCMEKKLLKTFSAHKGEVTLLRFFPDSRYFLSLSEKVENIVILWDRHHAVRLDTVKLSKLPQRCELNERGDLVSLANDKTIEFFKITFPSLMVTKYVKFS